MTTDVVAPETVLGRPTATARRWRGALIGFISLELLVLFVPTVIWLWGRWTMSVWQNAHGMFVPLLAGWLAWHELKRHPAEPLRGSGWGFIFLIPALALHALDAGMNTQLLSAVALFLTIPGFSLLLLGTAKTGRIAFPIAFLIFALPIPLGFTEPIHMALRQIISVATAAALPLVGVSVFREGTVLYTTAGPVSIGDACSGFSTLYASVTFATLVAFMARTWQRRALVLVASVPVAMAANLLRVFALTLMVALGEGWLLDTFVHPLSGMLTFALALPILLWLGDDRERTASR
jgi:exosortase